MKISRGARTLGALLIALLVVFVVSLVACHREPPGVAVKYQCPMHPSFVSDQPGDCTICGMRLVPVEVRTAPPTPAAPSPEASPSPSARRILFYRNPMNPSITSPVPAKDEMGMDYVPVYESEAAPAPVEGFATVALGPQGLRLAGVQTATARRGVIRRTIRAVGLVVPDERRIRHVHTKIAGWIEKLYVNFTGQAVRAGEPILRIYSPELLASQEEYLRARQTAAKFAGSALPEVRQGGADLVAAARRRLELFDVPESLIARLDAIGKPERTVTLLAPVSGYVTTKDVFEGQQVEPGTELFTITDLQRVWVEGEFYEYEAKLMRVGQEARVLLPYDPRQKLAGRVTFIYPTVDPASRTLKLRLEFDNPDLALKPGMFADVEADVESRAGIVVPDSALVDTGLRQLVFVDLGAGRFEPRAVTVGVRTGGQVLILSGLAAGDDVAVRANFLLDSESRLRAAITQMQGSSPSPTASPGGER
ncbi:MAG: efflux RND transporter periplasmic adaptor subunit [Acidobacteriota bacterium]